MLHAFVVDFEKEFSRFQNDSVLMKLNTSRKYEVSERFLRLLFRCREIFTLTNGYFNPLVDIRTLWYTESFDTHIFTPLQHQVNNNFWAIKNYGNLVELEENMFLDFWSIAKWFLADEVTKILQKNGYTDTLVNFWWDLKASWKNVFWKHWSIWIPSPFESGKIIETLDISQKSISTSGTYVRNWEISWEQKNHIMNPFSSDSQQDLVSVSVIDFYGYKTDALATALVAMWWEKAKEFCEQQRVSCYLIHKSWEIFQKK